MPLLIAVLFAIESQYYNTKEPKELYPLCLTAFGITVTLAQLAFRFIPQVRTERTTYSMLYAGEKFSLSAVLLLQLTMIVFCKDAISKYLDHNHVLWVDVIANSVLGALWVLIGGTAIISWWWAYESFHEELWLNWKERVDQINSQTDKAQSKLAAPTIAQAPSESSEGEKANQSIS